MNDGKLISVYQHIYILFNKNGSNFANHIKHKFGKFAGENPKISRVPIVLVMKPGVSEF
jgi:hypothetical protein